MLSGREEHQPLMPNVQHAFHHGHRRKYVHFGCVTVSIALANCVFAFITVAGKFGQSITLTLWKNSTSSKCDETCELDSYFLYSFSGLVMLLVFGLWLCLIRFLLPNRLSETEKSFSQVKLFLVGFFGALSIVLFVVSENKIPPDIRRILGCCLIPLTVLLRYIMLKKVPSLLQSIAAFVIFGLFFVNFIEQFYKNTMNHGELPTKDLLQYEKYLWLFCFACAFIPLGLMNVVEEEGLKQQNQSDRNKQVNLIYFLFWVSLYQFLVILILFWADIIPSFGNCLGASEFGKRWADDFKCLFGYGGPCDVTYGGLFVLMNITSFLGSALLLRHAEGATYLAVVVSVCTPAVSLFWYLLKTTGCDLVSNIPRNSVWYNSAACLGMIVFIVIYYIGPPEHSRQRYQRDIYEEYIPDQIPSLDDPIRDLYRK